ncbi:MAG: type I methionyl aminopeptidase [Patescibacteria group bacterium]|jgi:methionyl aminopeptidase
MGHYEDISLKRDAMIRGGKILKQTVDSLQSSLKAGITTREIDKIATSLIKKYGGDLSFNKVEGYHWATCLSVNETVVHGIPNEYVVKDGDILKLDIGVYFGGYHVDWGTTYVIGGVADEKVRRFLEIGQRTLDKAVAAVRGGEYISTVTNIIDTGIHGAGYKVIRELTGHAVGRELHEPPYIPGNNDELTSSAAKFKVGTAYAVEVIYSFSDDHITYAGDDGWGLKTENGSLSACFEHSVFVDTESSIILVK